MAMLTKRRTGKGYEREIQSLTRLRTAIVLDDRLDMTTHEKALKEIDTLIATLSSILKRGLNIAS